jgi:hypothetical protein
MSDLLERLAAANPVPESRRPPIEDVWRKVAEGPQRPREPWQRTGRWVAAAVAVAIPVVAVLVMGNRIWAFVGVCRPAPATTAARALAASR